MFEWLLYILTEDITMKKAQSVCPPKAYSLGKIKIKQKYIYLFFILWREVSKLSYLCFLYVNQK